jgi:hypothetical protein
MTSSVKLPTLPIARDEYSREQQDQYTKLLTLFIQQLLQDSYVGVNTFVLQERFPDETQYADLADRTVYLDQAHGSFLRMKPSNPVVISLTSEVSGVLPVPNGGTGLPGPYANGQMLIGNGSTLTANTLTAGSNIAITNAAGSVTVNAVDVVKTSDIGRIYFMSNFN